MDSISGGREGQFNQAFFQQERLHELFQRIDRLSLILFELSDRIRAWNYDLVFRDLNTVLLTIGSKLGDTEIKELGKKKEELRKLIRNNPAFNTGFNSSFSGVRRYSNPNYENQDKISDELFLFRLLIENAMDKHNLSNPSKLNPSKAAIN